MEDEASVPARQRAHDEDLDEVAIFELDGAIGAARRAVHAEDVDDRAGSGVDAPLEAVEGTEHVDGTRVLLDIVIQDATDEREGAGQGDTGSEEIHIVGVVGGQPGDGFGPRRSVVLEDVGRAFRGSASVREYRPDQHRVSFDRDVDAEEPDIGNVRGEELLLFDPHRPVVPEYVGGALLQFHRGGILLERADHRGVAVQRDGEPEAIAGRSVTRRKLLGLDPAAAVVLEDVGRSCLRIVEVGADESGSSLEIDRLAEGINHLAIAREELLLFHPRGAVVPEGVDRSTVALDSHGTDERDVAVDRDPEAGLVDRDGSGRGELLLFDPDRAVVAVHVRGTAGAVVEARADDDQVAGDLDVDSEGVPVRAVAGREPLLLDPGRSVVAHHVGGPGRGLVPDTHDDDVSVSRDDFPEGTSQDRDVRAEIGDRHVVGGRRGHCERRKKDRADEKDRDGRAAWHESDSFKAVPRVPAPRRRLRIYYTKTDRDRLRKSCRSRRQGVFLAHVAGVMGEDGRENSQQKSWSRTEF